MLRTVSWWIEWPAGVVRIGVVFLVATAVVAVVVRYPQVLRDSDRDADRNSSLSFSDREIAGGNGLVADQLAVYAARALIPADATYHVAVGPTYQGGSDLTRDNVAGYYRYFLLPRRPAEAAPWVICYGCDTTVYGPGTKVIWQDDEGLSIVKVPQ
jgi:hypothetical protein